jgi:hypothetical protein
MMPPEHINLRELEAFLFDLDRLGPGNEHAFQPLQAEDIGDFGGAGLNLHADQPRVTDPFSLSCGTTIRTVAAGARSIADSSPSVASIKAGGQAHG